MTSLVAFSPRPQQSWPLCEKVKGILWALWTRKWNFLGIESCQMSEILHRKCGHHLLRNKTQYKDMWKHSKTRTTSIQNIFYTTKSIHIGLGITSVESHFRLKRSTKAVNVPDRVLIFYFPFNNIRYGVKALQIIQNKQIYMNEEIKNIKTLNIYMNLTCSQNKKSKWIGIITEQRLYCAFIEMKIKYSRLCGQSAFYQHRNIASEYSFNIND